MVFKKYTAVYVVCLAMMLGSGSAVAASQYQELKDLYEGGQLKKAYALAVEMLPSEEGDPEFDFLYGQVAIDSGNVGYGVFALERVLLLNPDNHVARLELARGYFLLGQKERAKAEFDKVLAVNPPQPVKEKIALYLRAMSQKKADPEQKKTLKSAYARFTLGYDSNVNSATSDQTFSTPTLGTGTFSDDSLASDSIFGKIGAGGRIVHAVEKGKYLYAGLNAEQKDNFGVDDYDLGTVDGYAGISIVDENRVFKLTASAQHMDLDYSSYLDLANITAETQYKLSKTTNLNGYFRVGAIQYPNLENRDAYSFSAGIGATHRLKGKFNPTLSGMVFLGRETPMEFNETSEELAEKKSVGMMLKQSLNLSKQSLLDLSFLWQKTRYGAEDPVFQVTRQDDYMKFGVDYTHKINKNWKMMINASHSQVSSNVSIQEYDRDQISVSIQRDL